MSERTPAAIALSPACLFRPPTFAGIMPWPPPEDPSTHALRSSPITSPDVAQIWRLRGTPYTDIRIFMAKNGGNPRLSVAEVCGSLHAGVGYSYPQKPQKSAVSDPPECAKNGYLYPEPEKCPRKAFLDGNFARRQSQELPSEHEIWDTTLPGFGMRVQPGGHRSWFVRVRHRRRHRRITLGSVEDVEALVARRVARRHLVEVALDGLPRRPDIPVGPVFIDYAEEFWRDCAHHWKPSTQRRNRTALDHHILPFFAEHRLNEMDRTDIVRWRDDCANVAEAKFNRALPVLAAMLKYAEQLGYRPKGKNPCRGIERFRRKAMERFLSPGEYARLGRQLAQVEDDYPNEVAAIRLLIYTGARLNEICGLHWDWVQPPRLVLPDSKTGAKIIMLNRQALAILQSLPRHEGVALVFPKKRGKGHMSLEAFWWRFRRTCALPDVRLHDLRHSFASVAVREGVPLATIGRLLGHALPETTARYAHLADETIAEAAARVSSTMASALGVRP
ncbi:site-specific integrase [Novosphingobium sp. KCTC 2891]|uniref:site-specific integrase n=1 Tax=Novosphingobium sp. KCTC 2891 TaxID=2989730 RepID=UPI0022229193|nr:site-specific integrase [Novosphingobium sp. KCTC 2891]